MCKIDSTFGGKEAPERIAYRKFNIFSWLYKWCVDCENLQKRLEDIHTEFPHFKNRDYPDLSYWISSGVSRIQSPLTVEELLEERPGKRLDYFLSYKEDSLHSEFSREYLIQNIGEAVRRDFDWGQELIAELKRYNEPSVDIWETVIQGIQQSNLNPKQWDSVIELFLNDDELVFEHRYSISELLRCGYEREKSHIPLELFEKCDIIAVKILEMVDGDLFECPTECFALATSHPGGNLAFYWIYALSKTNLNSQIQHNLLVEPFRTRLESIITATSDAGKAGRVVLASQINYLFKIDPEWTRSNVIKLLDWNLDVEQARQAWDGWLYRGQIYEPLLEDMIPLYKKSFSHLASELISDRELFVEHLAEITVYWINDPLENGWLFDFLNASSKEFVGKFGFG